MSAQPMTPQDFEQRYRAERDPWAYEHSDYERDKYAATLSACGPGPHHCALELGGSIGVFSELLAPCCRRLVTIDLAPTAVTVARARLAQHPHVQPLLGTLPDDLPELDYDLVVASEILYYLDGVALRGTLAALRQVMKPGARLVAVHWRPAGADRPHTADQVHALLSRQSWLEPVRSGDSPEYRLDLLRRR